MFSKKMLLVPVLVFLFVTFHTSEARKNCCARHGGVSHCDHDGYYRCSDGSFDTQCQCGGYWNTFQPPLDYTQVPYPAPLRPPRITACPTNAQYSYRRKKCTCHQGYKAKYTKTQYRNVLRCEKKLSTVEKIIEFVKTKQKK